MKFTIIDNAETLTRGMDLPASFDEDDEKEILDVFAAAAQEVIENAGHECGFEASFAAWNGGHCSQDLFVAGVGGGVVYDRDGHSKENDALADKASQAGHAAVIHNLKE